MRGVEAILNAVPAASAEALRVGLASEGADNNFLPPSYEGDFPGGYFVLRSRTYGN